MKVSDKGWVRQFANAAVAGWLGAVALYCAAQPVAVTDAWARATVAGQKTAGAYAELLSESHAALVAVESPAADRVELHTMSMEGGIMRMRPLQRIELPARKAVKLAPGGLHLMLIDIKRQLKAGDRLPLILTIETQGGGKSVQKVEAEVRAVGTTSSHHH